MKYLITISTVLLTAVLLFSGVNNVQASKGGKGKNHKPTPTPTVVMRIPYSCEQDTCQGYRCVIGTEIRPVCYSANDIQSVSCTGGSFEFIPSFTSCYTQQYFFNWGI